MNQRVIGLITIMIIVCGRVDCRRCLLHNKKCVSHCPLKMHPYNTRCDKDTTSQRTCKSPLIYNIGYTCGWSRCDCNGDLLLDETRGICVSLTECQQSYRGKPHRRRQHRKFKLPNKLRLKEDDDYIW